MKQTILAILITSAATAASAADVGVSISVGQPGFYGEINIGNAPAPVLVNPQPVIIERAPVNSRPIYLRVPSRHIKQWKKYCHHYNACNKQVYFVQDSWYQHKYVPHYQAERRHDQRNNKRAEKHRNKHDNHRDDDDRGRGH